MPRPSPLAPLLLVFVVACSSSSSDGGGGNEGPDVRGGPIDSPEAVQGFFETVAPQLIALFTELADQLTVPVFAEAEKQGDSFTATCPEGGSLTADLLTSTATLDQCGAEGVVLDAMLNLVVFPPVTDPLTQVKFYSATFDGPLDVSGSFTGTIVITFAFFEWSDPPSEDNTIWEVSAMVDGQSVFVSSFGSNMEPDPNGDVTVRFGGPCVFDEGNFACESECPNVCIGDEVVTSAFCAVDNVCECFCSL